MVWLSGRDIARSTIEMMRSDGYVDAWRTMHADPDASPATPSRCGSRTCGSTTCSRRRRTPNASGRCEVRKTPEVTRTASDHFPLLVELTEN